MYSTEACRTAGTDYLSGHTWDSLCTMERSLLVLDLGHLSYSGPYIMFWDILYPRTGFDKTSVYILYRRKLSTVDYQF